MAQTSQQSIESIAHIGGAFSLADAASSKNRMGIAERESLVQSSQTAWLSLALLRPVNELAHANTADHI
jgi:hypothetical protein